MIASVLALVFTALTLISVSSTFALKSYLIDRMDDELLVVTNEIAEILRDISLNELDSIEPEPTFPSEYVFMVRSVTGVGRTYSNNAKLGASDMPPYLTSVDAIQERVDEQPYTANSPNKRQHWRMRIATTAQGDIIYVGRNMGEIDFAMTRLVWIDLLVGCGVLIALAAVGAAVVRTSLRPLVEIEQTAGAIAAGDLTRRVPDPEPDMPEPQTELGRLARALNAMLTQIEAAFTARAQSETAARAAESAARDAADAAQVSESRALRSEGKMRQFVADASHELRTPLTTIRGFAELYRQGAVPQGEDVNRLMRRIEDEAARMGLLVEDLLLLARLDRERPLTLAPTELPVLAMEAVQAAQATAPERRIELEVRDEPELLVAYADDARLRQVIGNLMTNALVHTPPDAQVTLRLYAESGNRAVIEVADTGPGLGAEQQEHVFERFFRADEARTRHTDREATGTGLGLAIVAAIVRAHHGTVDVRSEPGKGATFRVSLPALDRENHPTS
ncbi:HAMP domain-containing sensor histidine kinase [Actinoplanes sp. NBRC 103695]|uniref:sensor histidine kinase n=1 Tax=Actinoplanes sp. NBRC 103695 TaxID=3032202 RepID=UPI0025532EF9|nr:HAMP domain-containing sensor histidine kinase [Actinoplanes sp. NBRC 103695]